MIVYHLIKKDLLVQKHSILAAFALIVFFSITLSNLGPVGMTVGIVAITYQFVLGASALEEKVNSDIILISLPIKKNIIVLAKYLSIYVYAACAIVGFLIIYLLTHLLNVPLEMPITLEAIAGSLIAITLFFSISFPLIFKFGYLKSKFANFILFFIVVFGGTMIIGNLAQNEQSNLSQKMLTILQEGTQVQTLLLLLIPLALIFTGSYFLSLLFYTNREF